MIELIILDFDDTLCLTEKSSYELENLIAQKIGFPPITRETHIKNWGKVLEEAIIERFPGINAEVFIEELRKTLPKLIKKDEIDVITDINLKTLDIIKSKGIKLAILTSRDFMEVKHLQEKKHSLSLRINAFYHKDNSDYLEPNPKVFDKILFRHPPSG